MKFLAKALFRIAPLVILALITGCQANHAIAAKSAKPSTDAKWRADGYAINATKIDQHAAYRPLRKVLVGLVSAAQFAAVSEAFPDIEFVFESKQVKKSHDFDAIFMFCRRGDTTMEKAPNASWVHVYSAGVDPCMALSAMKNLIARDQGVILTNSSGTAAPIIAEHTIAMMLSLSRGLHIFRDEQGKAQWSRGLANQGVTNVINGKTMLVLGLGSIGKEVARRADALGMRVLGTRHSSRKGPDYVEYVGLTDETLELAAQADVVVNALPLTDATRGFIDQEFFDTLPDGALYLSVGRGGTTDTDALLKALRNKSIAGAGLDVTDPEPLPSDHPLWQETNVIITPHLSGSGGNGIEKILELLAENIRRYQAGERMLNIVNTDLGY